LAAAFHIKGYDILTDDVMPVEIVADCPIVFPAYPQFKLFPEAVGSLGQDTERLSPVFKIHPNFPTNLNVVSNKLPYRFSGFMSWIKEALTRLLSYNPKKPLSS
jgi:hypothetical protein